MTIQQIGKQNDAIKYSNWCEFTSDHSFILWKLKTPSPVKQPSYVRKMFPKKLYNSYIHVPAIEKIECADGSLPLTLDDEYFVSDIDKVNVVQEPAKQIRDLPL